MYAPPTQDEIAAAMRDSGAPSEPEGPGAGQSGLEHYGNTATLGYLPHIQALVEGMLPNPSADVDAELAKKGFKIEQPGQSYVERRDENIKRLEQERRAHPAASAVGDVLGIGGSAILSGPALEALGIAAPAVKGASFGQKVYEGARAGGALGLASNPGDVEGVIDPIQGSERLHNAELGALVGGGSTAAAEGLSTGARALGDKLKTAAERRSFKGLGPYSREAQQAYSKGQLESVGRELLDSGIYDGKMPVSYQKVAERAGKVRGETGEKIGALLDALESRAGAAEGATAADQAFAVPGKTAAKAGVSRQAIADALEHDLLTSGALPGSAPDNASLKALIEEFRNGGESILPLKQARELKQLAKSAINWDRLPGADIPLKEQFYRSLYGKVGSGLEDAASALAGDAGEGTAKEYMALKNRYGAMKQAERIAGKREAKEFANRLISPSDYMMGGLGATAGFASGGDLEDRIKRGLVGAGAGAANHMARIYGNQVAARLLDSVASKASSAAPVLASVGDNPAALQAAIAGLAEKARGAGRLQRNPEDIEFKNPQLMKFFENNPDVLDRVVADEKTRKAIRSKIGRKPAGANAVRLKALEE
jgi:hypothetical protein